MSFDLFSGIESAHCLIALPMQDADVSYCEHFFTPEQSDAYYQQLLSGINWKQERITFYGKEMDLPRLTAWYGNDGKSYTYSGIRVEPDAWTPTLLEIKHAIEKEAGVTFNSVLLNQYRHGQDGVAWHADDELELGSNPVIASVSFGEPRSFHLKHKENADLKQKLTLQHGSLLIMGGRTQHCWLHQVPKSTRPMQPRINLTFRVIR